MSAPPPASARALAPAKVNLTLQVRGRRADGFHELRTHLLALALADEVCVRARGREGVALAVSGPRAEGVPGGEENLAWRAAAAVWAAAREQGAADVAGLEVELVKRIPAQAGLGGASADAAAALVAAAAVLGLDLRGAERAAWAADLLAGLGSDCPFFLAAADSGLALCEGRGERVRPLAASAEGDWSIVVVTPKPGCPTGAVYAALAPAEGGGEPRALPAGPAAAARGALHNDLEAAALRAVPALAPWRELLDGAGAAHFRLAGSGSSFFGLFDDDARAREALAAVEEAAAAAGLVPRAALVTRPAGAGARLVGPRA
ncbi:MAG: 4-(cytidine 5'-diphospho)-2-C-methyl-D-erythritol kinase [Planctomycetota bacterium]|nr:4-(cytidine 5'-diphospho)-2-C-methyl-D-erythritol kinase [Planctomycetota bacterium]MDP6763573.1 4-(cytidine 5'-diphospho)-2-C-methyl-D-erythritol kinase [Planctomycetota bacterium]MDP6988212.1 4-(cytidine 5'-diphospho)-2-C-methyl-D-erythritol kinase [Planctomycetota bacterium]